MKRYEGLFILRAAAQDDNLKEIIDKITAQINAVGGRVETTQKMDRRSFARVADKKDTAGFYVNFIFAAPPSGLQPLRNAFVRDDDVFRIMITEASAAPATAAPPVSS